MIKRANAQPNCGDIITANTVLSADLGPCGSSDGLDFGASGITLDCQGHSILGPGPSSLTLGISITSLSNETVKNCTVNGFYGGIDTASVNNVTITGNTLVNDSTGLFLSCPSPIATGTLCTVYNNIFNGTFVLATGGPNHWNITKTPGTNIVGGPYLGGNFWGGRGGYLVYPNDDPDADGIGDIQLPFTEGGSIAPGGDYLPLVFFDFSLSNNGPIMVSPAHSGSNTIWGIYGGGNPQPVIFSCSGLPIGASCSFFATSDLPSFSSLLTIATTGATPTGSFPITVTGSGGGKTHTTTFTLMVVSGSVGGSTIPVDKLALLAPILYLAAASSATVSAILLFKRKK